MIKALRIKVLASVFVLPLAFVHTSYACADDGGAGNITFLKQNQTATIGMGEHDHDTQYDNEFSSNVAMELEAVNSELEELKANTIPNYESRVDMNPQGYFETPNSVLETVPELPVKEKKSYVYDKKQNSNVPQRAFNNVR